MKKDKFEEYFISDCVIGELVSVDFSESFKDNKILEVDIINDSSYYLG